MCFLTIKAKRQIRKSETKMSIKKENELLSRRIAVLEAKINILGKKLKMYRTFLGVANLNDDMEVESK